MKINYSIRIVASLAATLFTGNLASAADAVWDGGGAPDGNWLTAVNWEDDAAPAAGDRLFFLGNVQTDTTNDFTAATAFDTISFDAAAGAFNLYGNSIVLSQPTGATIATGGSETFGGAITNASANGQTIHLPLSIAGGSHRITLTGAGDLNLAGAVTLDAGSSVAFSKPGAGNINLTGSGLTTNGLNNILGGWAVMAVDLLRYTNWATLDASGNVIPLPASGYTTIAGSGGNVPSDPSANVKITTSTGTATVNSGASADINSLNFGVTGTGNQIVNVAAGTTLRLGSKGGILNASSALGVNRVLTIGTAAGTGTLTAGGPTADQPGDLYIVDLPLIGTGGNQIVINSVMTDNGAGSVKVHTFGHVSFPNVAHSYSGGTYIHGGRVQTQPFILGSGPIYVFAGGQLFFNGNGTCTNDIFLAGIGNGESTGNGAIRMGGSGRIITGTITLMADAATANGVFNGRITGPGRLIVGAGTGNGAGTMQIGATNDYDGDTLINGLNATGASTLQMNVPLAMPYGSGKGNVILNGSVAASTFNLNGNDQIINGLSSMGTTGARTVNAGGAGTVTLTVGDNDADGNFAGVLQNNGAATFNVTKIGGGTQIISGANTYNGATTVSGGELVTSTASTGGGGYTVADGASLGVRVASSGASLNMSSLVLGSATGAGLSVDTGTFGNPSAAPLNITGDFTAEGTITVSIKGTALTAGTFTVLQYAGNRFGTATFSVQTSPRVSATINDDQINKIVTVTIISADTSIKWDGGVAGNWDINNAANQIWIATPSGTPTHYIEDPDGNDAVVFDDSATGTTTVNITTDVAPTLMTVTNDALEYTLTGSGKLTGTTGLTKQGPGKLVVANSGDNDFSGGITISAGTLQVGANGTDGKLPTGSVANEGTLSFNRSDDITSTSSVSGAGTLAQAGSGVLTLAAASTYTGPTTVSSGTLRIVNNGSLGTIPGGQVTVDSGATLDVGGNPTGNNANYGAKEIRIAGTGVGGLGAIINSGSVPQQNVFQNVVLTGSATVGGPGDWLATGNPGRWDIRGGTPVLNLGGFTLTKVGDNQVTLVGVAVSAGDIVVNDGLFAAETTTSFSGSGTITVNSGAILGHFRNNSGLFNRPVVMNGGGIRNNATSGDPTFNDSPITLDADAALIGSTTAGYPITFNGVISGASGIVKQGAGNVILTAENTYGGTSLVSTGTLALSGSGSISQSATINIAAGATLDATARTDGTLTLADGQTLVGNGSIAGILVADSGSIVSPGTSVGALTVSGAASLLAGSDTVMEIDAAANTNDVLNAASVAFGGTLTVNNLDGTLALGQSYKIFNAPAYSGAFGTINLPTLPEGLVWDNTLDVDGTITVVNAVEILVPSINLVERSGNDLVLSGTNGTFNGTYYVVVSSDISLPLASWTIIATNVFNGDGTFSVNIPIDTEQPQQFFNLLQQVP